jgi:hypothetical protein
MMKITILCNGLLAASLVAGFAGCSETEGVQERTKIKGPEGTTTVTKDTKVETSGSNPPAVHDTTTKEVRPNP